MKRNFVSIGYQTYPLLSENKNVKIPSIYKTDSSEEFSQNSTKRFTLKSIASVPKYRKERDH